MLEPTFKFKICLLGEGSVGKTSLIYRYVENKFREDYKSTLGVNLLQKIIKVEDRLISAQIWDLGGQDSFKSLRNLYLEGSQGALLVFDLTNEKSFEKVSDWLNDFRRIRTEGEPVILIGNKADLMDHIKVQESEASDYAKEKNLDLVITSAKTGENVENAFIKLFTSIYHTVLEEVSE